MIDVVERAISRWPVGKTFSLRPLAHQIGLEIILRVVMGIQDPQALARWTPAFKRFLETALSQEASLRFLRRSLGALRHWRTFHDARKECDQLIHTEIAARRHLVKTSFSYCSKRKTKRANP